MPTGVENQGSAYASNYEDPLTIAIRPSPDETHQERKARIEREHKAKAISDAIDEDLQKDAITGRKGTNTVKILLLGQSESGKSTTLKNFQLMYEPKAFYAELASWRAIIQLNIVRSIRLILDAIDHAKTFDAGFSPLSPELLRLRLRLLPLLQVEQALLRRLRLAGAGECLLDTAQLSHTDRGRAFLKEIGINAAVRWKEKLSFAKSNSNSSGGRAGLDVGDVVNWNDPNDPGTVLHACSEDMTRLWNDPVVRELLARQSLRLEEVAGFFLDSLDRVTSLRYVPTNNDILRARLKTLGVTEHKFRIGTGSSQWQDWRVYDVGGHRSQRAAWVPYFDDMDTIIFLAPTSSFDQVLSEDTSVNRLEDSVNLWKSLVSNKLLKDTNLILFLNKIDILKAKLNAGVKMADFVVSYGDRPNDYEHVSAYLRRKFGTDHLLIPYRSFILTSLANILSQHSSRERMFYCHFTTVTDTESTKIVLHSLKDMLLRQNLLQSSLIQ
ncbi:hypothetical protein AX15_001192 [Amanita polypyramis BW_CC]|nr:hypothetical protein AX15_001192 [Amanita polypyramis BW_CC]